jgi:hypothetical protein
VERTSGNPEGEVITYLPRSVWANSATQVIYQGKRQLRTGIEMESSKKIDVVNYVINEVITWETEKEVVL